MNKQGPLEVATPDGRNQWARAYLIEDAQGALRPVLATDMDADLRRELESTARNVIPLFDHGNVTYQARVLQWLEACLGPVIANDPMERSHRFLEEALELVQACGCTASEAHQLVDYTFGRPVGEKRQEAGGVNVTFHALCQAHGIDAQEAGDEELRRVWAKIDQVRAKQAGKPKHSPLPGRTPGECESPAPVTFSGEVVEVGDSDDGTPRVLIQGSRSDVRPAGSLVLKGPARFTATIVG